MSNKNEKFTQSLRELINFIEQNPEVGEVYSSALAITSFTDTKEQLVDLIRNSGGKWAKCGTDYHFGITRKIGSIPFYVYVNRDLVCTARKVTKTIPARAEQFIPATPEQTVEVTEYECPDSILRPAPALVAEADIEVLEREKMAKVALVDDDEQQDPERWDGMS